VTINLYDFLLVVCVVIVYRFRDIIVCLTYMTASDLERSGCVRSRRLKWVYVWYHTQKVRVSKIVPKLKRSQKLKRP